MISPISGNGMSLAFESAELALPILTDYSAGRLSWPEALAVIAKKHNAAFQRRLAWNWRVQRALFRPKLPKLMMKCVSESAWIWRQFFKWTR
jgi:flavin-dependent dehydrogenase